MSRIKSILFVLMGITLFSLPTANLLTVQAQEDETDEQEALSETIVGSGRGLVIDEYLFDFGEVQPGQTIVETFSIINDFEDGKAVNLTPRAVNFRSNGINGDPQFIDQGTLPFESSLADWIGFGALEYSLDFLGDEEELIFTITVPENAEPGDKYAAIFPVNTDGSEAIEEIERNAQEAFGLGIDGAPGPLIFLSVAGDTNVAVTGDDLYTTNLEGEEGGFFFHLPVVIVPRFANEGNIASRVQGAIYLYTGDDFEDYIQKWELNPEGGRLLADSTREFPVIWDDGFIRTEVKLDDDGNPVLDDNGDPFYATKYHFDDISDIKFGQYNVKVLYNYLDEDGNLTNTFEMNHSFTVFPWPLFVLILIIIVLIALFLFYQFKIKRNEE